MMVLMMMIMMLVICCLFTQIQHTVVLSESLPTKLTSIGEAVTESKGTNTDYCSEQLKLDIPACEQGE